MLIIGQPDALDNTTKRGKNGGETLPMRRRVHPDTLEVQISQSTSDADSLA
jgi:hypothetical protein